MNGNHIKRVLSSNKRTKKHFAGVFARDQLVSTPFVPKSTQAPLSHYVCNLDNSDSPGSHWVVVEFDHKTSTVYYFDSYGLGPLHQDILTKLATDANKVIWNNKTLQSNNTSVCGQYCILFCLLRASGYSFERTINLIHHSEPMSTDTRDHVVHSLIDSLFPQALKNFNTNVHDISAFTSTNPNPACVSTFL